MAALWMLLLVATTTDFLHRRIPNILVGAGLISALAVRVLHWHDQAPSAFYPIFLDYFFGVIAGFVSLLPLYLLRACGAGDVKLMAMVGGFLGPNMALSAALYTLAAGGVLSLIFMMKRGVAAKTVANLRFLVTDWVQRFSTKGMTRPAPLATTAARLPYAVAIAIGTVFAVWRAS